VKHFLKWSTA